MSSANPPARNWIVVACAEHVARGRAGGFMQAGHGKRAPLARLRPGDRVACYSPTEQLGGKVPLQAFTAIGVVRGGQPYAFDMGDGFVPFRRDVDFVAAHVAPIRPLLDALEFAQPRSNWGSRFRYGLFSIADTDLRCIAEAMQADLGAFGLLA
jgi:EVE domain